MVLKDVQRMIILEIFLNLIIIVFKFFLLIFNDDDLDDFHAYLFDVLKLKL